MNRRFGMSAARFAGLVLGIATALPAAATIINLQASLDAAQANAGMGSGGTGTGAAIMMLDDATNVFTWTVEWSGLTGIVVAAHFHGPALPTENAGVVVPINHAANPSMGIAVLSDNEVADLLAGLWYINIHSTFALPGEIRGQVGVVPEPGSLGLLGAGLIGIAWRRRRS